MAQLLGEVFAVCAEVSPHGRGLEIVFGKVVAVTHFIHFLLKRAAVAHRPIIDD
jgi:hypothetical protein